MKLVTLFLLCVMLFLELMPAFGQRVKFNQVIQISTRINSMAQDRQGYIWFSTSAKGLQRYDGVEVKSYSYDPRNPNSLASNFAECLWIDRSNTIWIGTYNAGLDWFDPANNTFKHFRHNSKDNSSLASDTITAILEDRSGNLWVGTYSGLDLLDKGTGKFRHYANKPGDSLSLSYDHVRVIYEDKAGVIWVGCGSPFNDGSETAADGGLNRLNSITGKFTRYMHNAADPSSIASNKVRALLEDSKGNFWVGTGGDGLHTMDRAKGSFTHHYYDPAQPEKLSRPVLYTGAIDHITFINEDATGAIWIGSYMEGINRYDPVTKKVTHYGLILQGNSVISYKDTITGLINMQMWNMIISKDNLIWICTLDGAIYNVNPLNATIPFHPINNGLDANTFYYESVSNILWIGTEKGLIRKNLDNQNQKEWVHDPLNANSLPNDTIAAMRVDEDGKFWMATEGGVSRFDPRSNIFVNYRHNEKNIASLSSNALMTLCIDHNKNVWIGSVATGLDMLDIKTGIFTNYRRNLKDSSSLSNNYVMCITADQSNSIWVGTDNGLNYLEAGIGKFRHYLINASVSSVFIDAKGIVWAGTTEGLYYFNKATDQFILYIDPNSRVTILGVLHIMEDDKSNLWVSTIKSIIKINAARDALKIYGESYGIHISSFAFADNFKGKNGRLFFGDQYGYYTFFPDQLTDNDPAPFVNITSFKLSDQEVKPAPGGILNLPLWEAKEIKLNYDQNVFSFDFTAISFTDKGNKQYLFMLENYDNNWQHLGTDHKAYFFNIPPGTYIFHAKGVNSNGTWAESTIRIVITPPWWKTWWAYTIFGLLFISCIAGFMYYRSAALRRENRILEEKVAHRTDQLELSLKNLKATQTQLIQSEKMASLGELTAGIAHEIQNPLNFVNNFAEVNKELLTEMKDEINNGNMDEVKALANDIIDNEEKIIHHGKRADAIVKGMLQHSRSSNGIKESVNINALADEYLRLAYHGLRAKDKIFNASLQTDFDEGIGNISIIPQDIGRVILNLFTNAFYAVTEKKKAASPVPNGENEHAPKEFEPKVSVSTKRRNGQIEITVTDNGNGIPQKILDKIFQPFFTTKPTGQGTGLGLSLSYDIIKAHGGQLNVETQEGEGTKFIIQLPIL